LIVRTIFIISSTAKNVILKIFENPHIILIER